ncbi:MAG: hypothetical protein M1812_003009 [Candelaria pacifica]|nr:MAG: hypothetical protein M1812_003009 [Candelaria pacifica]
MTNISSSSFNTHTAPQLDSITALTSSNFNLPNNTGLAAPAPAEDEPYTIKCICAYQDDDGSTVFCERCETWQHIECYYPAQKVPDEHNCVDCEPRPLDPRRATERQKKRREQIDFDRKPKRPAGKSHKKKAKDATQNPVQVNGWSHLDNEATPSIDGRSGSPRDQPPPAKRTKTSHGASSSISSQAGLPAIGLPDARKRAGSVVRKGRSQSTSPTNISPTALNNELYSPEFMRLHREEPGDVPMQANLFSNIGITGSLSLWCQDRDVLAQDTGGLSPHDVFQRLDQPIDELPLPEIVKRIKEHRNITCDGMHPLWQYLTIESLVPMYSIVGEIKGQIGHRQEYLQDSTNRWQLLEHPDPFVFFHPELPIYIDTRSEGTRCRYVRRSCRPNLAMKTIITNGTEYHFCLFAKEDINPGTEITIGWDMSPRIVGYLHRAILAPLANGSVKGEPLTEEEVAAVSTWVSRILANFGGCACDGAQECFLARFDRRRDSVLTGIAATTSNGNNLRKPKKDRSNIAPSNAVTSINGPSGSGKVDHSNGKEEQDDSRSTSSVRSKSGSRDITPSTHLSSDLASVSFQGLSDREKRKIAAAERTFDRLEHDNTQKKKKRSSAGSNLNTPSASISVSGLRNKLKLVTTANILKQRQLGHPPTASLQPNSTSTLSKQRSANTNMSSESSDSPTKEAITNNSSGSNSHSSKGRPNTNTPHMQSPTPSIHYTTTSTQTEPESDTWYNTPPAAIPRKPYMSLIKRLLMRCHEDRKRLEAGVHGVEDAMSTGTNGTIAALTATVDRAETRNAESSTPPLCAISANQDIEMQDAGTDSRQPLIDAARSPQIEKPRPPDDPRLTQEAASQTSVTAIKPPPPPPPTWNGSKASTSHEVNGFRSTALRVQLPPTPQFSMNSASTHSSAGTPTSAAGSVVQSPFHANSYPPAFSSAVATSVAPSPIKKKLSLSDYVSRRSKAETPASTPTTDKPAHATSPNLPFGLLRMSSSLAEEVKAPGTLEGSAIVDTPTKEEADPLNTHKDPRPGM